MGTKPRVVPRDEPIPTDKPYVHIQFNNLAEAASGAENLDASVQIGNIAFTDEVARLVKIALAEVYAAL